MNRLSLLFCPVIALSVLGSAWAQSEPAPSLQLKPALITAAAARAQMLGADCAGHRAVVVGERGTVLIGEAGNSQWHQARSVPVDVLLTSTSFVDEKHGWAVGHWGVILHTEDGGETWGVQRNGLPADRPLFSVHFSDRYVGVATGLWNLILRTTDGGRHWQPVELAGDQKTDASFYALFDDAHGVLFAVGERGLVLRSPDQGVTWEQISTGHAGSLWAGVAARSTGTLIVAGLRGAVLRSTDHGKSWARVSLPITDSITGLSTAEDGRVVAVGAEGLVLESRDDGVSFLPTRRPDRVDLNGLAAARCGQKNGASLLAVTAQGPVYLSLEPKK